jgi:hypothetical protein
MKTFLLRQIQIPSIKTFMGDCHPQRFDNFSLPLKIKSYMNTSRHIVIMSALTYSDDDAVHLGLLHF